MTNKELTWYVYIAHTETDYYYTGITTDVLARIAKHNAGTGAKFARMHGGLKLAYSSEPMTKSDALKREAEIKKWSRLEKVAFITQSSVDTA